MSASAAFISVAIILVLFGIAGILAGLVWTLAAITCRS